MKLILDLGPQLIEAIPELSLAALRPFGRNPASKQAFLISILMQSYERSRAHREHTEADSFAYAFLRQGLRMRGSSYQNVLMTFYEFERANRGYSLDRGYTKTYRLHHHIRDALHAVYASNTPAAVLCADTGERITAAQLPANGISDVPGLFVPSVLPLSGEAVERALIANESYPLDEGKTATREDAKHNLQVAARWVKSLGGLPNMYQLTSQGRLGPVGSFHVITMPSRVRRLLFAGSGLVDYDIASCFASVFVSLGNSMGFRTEQIEGYLANRSDAHSMWAGITGHARKADFKTLVNSWLSGGTLSACGYTAGSQLIGKDGMEKLCASSWATALHAEINHGMKIVVDAAKTIRPQEDEVLVNAVGATLSLNGDAKRRPATFAQKCSHLLTGYEQFSIRALASQVEGLAVIYDGILAPPVNTHLLEDHLRAVSTEQLGITLDLTLKATPF